MTRLVRRSWQLFRPLLAGANLKDRLTACLGAVFGIALTAMISAASVGPAVIPWLVAPLGASAVLLFAVPASPLAQPWPVIGGNMISALVGVGVVHFVSDVPLAAGLAVGGAILAMSLTRSLHPPGGAAALTAVIGGKSVAELGLLFPFIPVAMNSILLVAAGIAFHRLSGHSYPHRWDPAPATPRAVQMVDIQPCDLDQALNDAGEAFDISREDLEHLFTRVELHAAQRRDTAP